MTTQDDSDLPPYPYPADASGPIPPGQPLPPYPPYIPEQDMHTSSGMPRSTLDKLHDDGGVVIQPPGQPLGPPPIPHGPDYTQPYGPDKGPLSQVWVPDLRPPVPGQTRPAGYDSSKGDGPANGTPDGSLKVNPADLHASADQYTALATQVAAISPDLVAQANQIIASHGAMGYPVAIGILRGLVAKETPLAAKADDFVTYATRFSEHANTYAGTDSEAASSYRPPTMSV